MSRPTLARRVLIALRLPPAAAAQLRTLAAQRHCSQSDLVADALEHFEGAEVAALQRNALAELAAIQPTPRRGRGKGGA